MAPQDRLARAVGGFLRARLPVDAPTRRLLVAVSGGADSTALLHLALATRDIHGWDVVAGHVHHGIRPDADGEEMRIRDLCRQWGVPFVSCRLRWRAGAESGGHPATPSEATMRRRRMRALRRFARERGCERILLAHHRDDNVETLLFRLCRGTGLDGLAGIPEERGPFLRPLLDAPRAALRAHLARHGIPWVDDPTNEDDTRARNRIRRHLLPLLETGIRPGSTAAIARSLRHLRSAAIRERDRAATVLASCSVAAPEGELVLLADRLRAEPAWVIPVLRSGVHKIGTDLLNTNTTFWTDLARAVIRGRSGLFFSPSFEAEVTGRHVRLRVRQATPASEPALVPAPIPWDGVTAWGAGCVRSSYRRTSPRGHLRVRGLSRAQVFDRAAVHGPVRVRGPEPGDRIPGDDSSGTHRLNDLLSEAGVPRAERARQPVIEDRDGILWAPGVRRAARALVGSGTTRLWVVRWSGRLPIDRAVPSEAGTRSSSHQAERGPSRDHGTSEDREE